MDKYRLLRKCLAVGIILLFVGTCLIPAIAQDTEKPLPASRGSWLYVGGSGPGNYTRIQDAIDNASENDTAFVYNGTYFETIQINKPLSLIGENENATIIWGDGNEDVIHVIEYTHYVTISRFTLISETLIGALDGIRLGYSNSFIDISFCKIIGQYDGIALQHSSHSIVSHCNITLSDNCGITSISNETKIVDCVFSDNSNPSIVLSGYNNFIQNCSMFQSANNGGLYLSSASNNTITNNVIFGNQDHGIFLHGTSNNLIIDNVIENNSVGIYCTWWKNQLNQIFHNNFIGNDINAIDETMNNSWDNGKEGNYWDDYNGSDTNDDGIGDTPYNISGSGENQDCYPLMLPYGMTKLTITIQPGLFKLSMLIKNVGNITAFNVQWNMTIVGFILFGKEVSGFLPKNLLPGEEVRVTSNKLFIGLGRIVITTTAWADNAPMVSAKINGILLLFFFRIIGK